VNRRSHIAFVGLLAMTLVGCSGPTTPLSVGTDSLPLALSLGTLPAVQQAPVGPISVAIPPALAPFLPAAPAGATTAPAPAATGPVVAPIVIAPTVACPAFSPIAPVRADGTTLPGPPADATYTYRAMTDTQDGSTQQTYAGPSVWKVTTTPVAGVVGAYDVTTAVTLGTVTTTRIFRVLTRPLASIFDEPGATDPNTVITLFNEVAGLPLVSTQTPNVGVYGPAGIYLLEQKSGASDFIPTVPIPLLQTPVDKTSFTGIGTDGHTDMLFTSTVTGTSYVNGCGTKLASTQVSLTGGLILTVGAGGTVSEVNFNEILDFGLLDGGLPLSDSGSVTGTNVGRRFSYIVNSRPKAAT